MQFILLVAAWKIRGFCCNLWIIHFSDCVSSSLCEKCPNREFLLVCILLCSNWIRENKDRKKLRIRALFTQCIAICMSWLNWIIRSSHLEMSFGKGVLKKMHQIYRRTAMPKCDFNKVTTQIYWNHTLAWVFSCKLAAFFQKNFYWEHLRKAVFELSSLFFDSFLIASGSDLRGKFFVEIL